MALTVSYLGGQILTASAAQLAYTGTQVDFAVGTLYLAVIAASNAGTSGTNSISSVTDSGGNTWESVAINTYSPGNVQNDGATAAVFKMVCTNAVADGYVYVNFSPNTPQAGINLFRINKTVDHYHI